MPRGLSLHRVSIKIHHAPALQSLLAGPERPPSLVPGIKIVQLTRGVTAPTLARFRRGTLAAQCFAPIP